MCWPKYDCRIRNLNLNDAAGDERWGRGLGRAWPHREGSDLSRSLPRLRSAAEGTRPSCRPRSVREQRGRWCAGPAPEFRRHFLSSFGEGPAVCTLRLLRAIQVRRELALSQSSESWVCGARPPAGTGKRGHQSPFSDETPGETLVTGHGRCSGAGEPGREVGAPRTPQVTALSLLVVHCQTSWGRLGTPLPSPYLLLSVRGSSNPQTGPRGKALPPPCDPLAQRPLSPRPASPSRWSAAKAQERFVLLTPPHSFGAEGGGVSANGCRQFKTSIGN